MSKRLLAFLPLSLTLLMAPGYASAAGRNESASALDACYAEAQWPVTTSSAYVYGNARQREQLTNGANREVYAMRRLCYRLSDKASDKSGLVAQCGDLIADTLKRHGDEAATHAERQKSLCEQLSAVDGL